MQYIMQSIKQYYKQKYKINIPNKTNQSKYIESVSSNNTKINILQNLFSKALIIILQAMIYILLFILHTSAHLIS